MINESDFRSGSFNNLENNDNNSNDTISIESEEILNNYTYSNNSNIETIKSLNKNLKDPKTTIFKCKNCSSSILIDFIKNNFDELNLSCLCSTNESIKIKIEEIERQLMVSNSRYKKYINYCNLCDIDLD